MIHGAPHIDESTLPLTIDADGAGSSSTGYAYQSDLAIDRPDRSFWYGTIRTDHSSLELVQLAKQFRSEFRPRLDYESLRMIMAQVIRCAIHADHSRSWCLYLQNALSNAENNFLRFLQNQGLIELKVGRWHRDPSRSSASRFRATEFLTAMFGVQKTVRFEYRSDIIELRDEFGMPMEKRPPKGIWKELKEINKLTRPAKITCSGLTYTGLQYKRVFNRDWQHGGRFYCQLSQQPKERRSTMLIDGEETIELDFSSMHIHLAYRMVGRFFLGEDAYAVHGFSREEMKIASLICLNGGDARAVRDHWDGEIRALAMPANTGSQVNPQVIKFQTYRDRAKAASEAFKAFHAPIASIWDVPDIGLKLQYQDSQIMAECLRRLCELQIVPICLHDSIRVPSVHANTVERIMREASFQLCGLEIPIKRN